MNEVPRLIVAKGDEDYLAQLKSIFGLPEDKLYTKVISDEALIKAVIVAPLEKKDEMTDLDGIFRLYYNNDGVYLEMIPSLGTGSALTPSDVYSYVERKRLVNLKKDALQEILARGYGYAQIAPVQNEVVCGEDVLVTVSSDEMKAYIRVIPPDPGGDRLTRARIIDSLKNAGVVYGIKEDAVTNILNGLCGSAPVCVAEGKSLVDGKNGELKFLFEREHSGSPIISENNGRVDYKNLDLYTSVKKGQVLCTRVPAVQGESGFTVKGKELKPRIGIEAKMPGGKNVELDAERLTLTAKVSGRVDFVNNTVVVSDCYSVDGDADLSVGNIDFEGDISIRGNVSTDLIIKATGTIEIFGVVQASHIIAGVDIILHSGMQGMDRGVLEAKGKVTAKYLERCKVKAEHGVYANTIIHCAIESGDSVEVSGKQGSIIGGSISAENKIIARNIGSVASTRTTIEVGFAPINRKRMTFLDSEIIRLEEEVEKYEKISRYLGQVEELSEDKQKLLRGAIVGKMRSQQQCLDYTKEMDELKQKLERSIHGSVQISDTVYPGVRINISNAWYTVEKEIKYATFRRIEGEVMLTSK